MLNIIPIKKSTLWLSAFTFIGLQGCGGGGEGNDEVMTQTVAQTQLDGIISSLNLAVDPTAGRTIPNINDPLPQLGKKLFFSKSLSGDLDVACASCHHPMLGGADALSMPIGVNAVQPQVMGAGRVDGDDLPDVPRNSPTIFNVALWDTSLFWDSRVESLGKESAQNGAASGISTPDSGFGVADANAGSNLVTAQARFPVTSVEEMKDSTFESGETNASIRDHLAARIGDFGEGAGELATNDWLSAFQTAFNSSASANTLITFDNIALAIAEYQRSMIFVNSPWQNYLDGDSAALSDDAIDGAILFFTSAAENGGGCVNCHSGSLFSDGQQHTVGFPQIGPGKGVGDDDDFGRELITGDTDDRYRFRTPSLLNVAVTAPYGHSGAYASLNDVMRHYNNPRNTVDDFFDDDEMCDLDQFENVSGCTSLYPDARQNSFRALNKLDDEQDDGTSLFQNVGLNGNERNRLEAFLNALTDPCVTDRNCMLPWMADEVADNPDDQALIATDINGVNL
ncbi:cytochrome-c peroxidase [Enterovibrio nigricans]|uniref:Cytochrome c peroxidase n=1 Tax=Enterovibrio nigricans DSM 22720 TaxID=1121868 RepID=A0A1T4VUQ0_9GAMM|nr:cytochrome c peroxidase [Enterovibrio nigricans]SKA68693.1 cytochrome c peroxidase [Enterovibrio nigricans DSM 22720]